MARRPSHRRRGGRPPYSTHPEYVTVQQALLAPVPTHPIPVPFACASLALARSIRSSRSFFPEKRVLFVTNNATKSRRNYKKKFDGLGIEAHVVRISPQFGAPLLANIPRLCACTARTKSSDPHMRLLHTSLRCSTFPWIRKCM